MSLASKTSCSVKILELGQRARNIPPDGLYECSEMWKIMYDLIVILKYTTRQYKIIQVYVYTYTVHVYTYIYIHKIYSREIGNIQINQVMSAHAKVGQNLRL